MSAADTYEKNAAAFEAETGFLAPGKDRPAAMGGIDADHVLLELWCTWLKLQKLRSTFSAVEADRDAEKAQRIDAVKSYDAMLDERVKDFDRIESLKQQLAAAQRGVDAEGTITDPELIAACSRVRDACEAHDGSNQGPTVMDLAVIWDALRTTLADADAGEAITDAQRLDWLEANTRELYWRYAAGTGSKSVPLQFAYAVGREREIQTRREHLTWCETVRAAIDAAMRTPDADAGGEG